jgi:mono/diheme cytochrome c family protein
MTRLFIPTLLLAWLTLASSASQAQTAPPATRGQLLYTTHCISCHNTQMHWRNNKQANDWDSLKAQVRRWQGAKLLQWSEADITEVARHLNDTIYRFPRPVARLGPVAAR